MDELSIVTAGCRVQLLPDGDCLIWSDHAAGYEDPDVVIPIAALMEVLATSYAQRWAAESAWAKTSPIGQSALEIERRLHDAAMRRTALEACGESDQCYGGR